MAEAGLEGDALKARKARRTGHAAAPAARGSRTAPQPRRVTRAEVLAGADLRFADLSGEDLDGLDLRGRDLTGAVLRGTRMHGTRLEGAILVDADILEALGIDLTGAVLPSFWQVQPGVPVGTVKYFPALGLGADTAWEPGRVACARGGHLFWITENRKARALLLPTGRLVLHHGPGGDQDPIWSLAVDAKDRLYTFAGSAAERCDLQDLGTEGAAEPMPAMARRPPLSLAFDAKGALWLAGPGHLYQLDHDGKAPRIRKTPLANRWITTRANRMAPLAGRRALAFVGPDRDSLQVWDRDRYLLPTVRLPEGSRADTIVTGPKGEAWFTLPGANAVGRYRVGDEEPWIHALPALGLAAAPEPRGMATGEDGSLWCTDPATCAIWRIEPDGHCTRFPLGEGIRPAQLLGGRNGTLVFTVEGRSWLGSIRVLPGPGVPADAALKAHPEAKGTRSATPERGEAQPEPAPATGQGMDLQVPRQVLERILAQNGHGAASPGQGQFAPRYGTPAQIEALLDRSLARRNLERWPNPQVKRHYFTYCRVPGVGRVPKGDTWVDTDNFVVVTKKNHRQATGLPYHTVTAAYPVLGDRPPWVPRHLDLPPEEEVLAPQQPRAPAHPVSKAQVRMEAMGFRLEHKNVRKIKRKYGHGTEADPQFAERYRFVEDYRALFAAGLAGPVLGPWEPPGEEGRWVHLCKVEGAGQHREEGAWKPIDAFAVITQPAPGGTGREVVQVFPVVPASLPELVPPAWGQQLQAWRAQPAAKPPETLAAPPDFGPLAWPPPQPALLQETKAPTGASGSRKPREFHARSAAQAGASAEDTATPRLETKASAPAPRTARPTLWEAWKALKARKLRLGKEAYAHIAQRHGFGSDQTECQFDEPYLSMDMFKRLLGEALASTRIGWWPTRDDDTTWLTFCRMEGSGWVFWDEAWHPCDHFVVVTRPGQSRGETLHQVVTAFPMTPDQILERTPAEAQAAVKAWLENPDLPPPFPAESPGAATTGSAGP